jgi:ABC-type sugar transport system substrate-binding protein
LASGDLTDLLPLWTIEAMEFRRKKGEAGVDLGNQTGIPADQMCHALDTPRAPTDRSSLFRPSGLADLALQLWCIAIIFVLLGSFSRAAEGKRIKVDFINAIPVHNQFWDNLVGAMQTAAQRLEIDFTNRIAITPEEMVSEATRLVKGRERPDYLIVTVHTGIHTKVLKIAEEAKLPVFLINAGLVGEDKVRYGGPREHFKYWIGQMLPNEEQAGYDLARSLLDRAKAEKKFAPDGRVPIMAITGQEGDFPTVMRNQGLEKAVAEDPAAKLQQIVTANWFREQAKTKVPLILKRYPDTKIIWVANDAMALGVITALEELGRKPGEDIFVGGIDWDDDAVKAVADGKLVATIGGHFLEGAWAMVLLCDYHHGIDFASERIDWRSEMLPLTKETVGNYLKYFGTGHWRKIDFRRFSKFYNRDLKSYNLSVKALLAESKAAEAKP